MSSRVLLGKSRVWAELLADAEFIAASDSKVLITGESGVGKELLARFIHEHSPRRKRPLITINCAGVPESLLESELFGHVRGSFTDAYRDRQGLLDVADGSTILLDEVGEMSLRMQALLLRFLETGEIQRVGSERQNKCVDVRVISATNRDLLEQTRRKEFREDLYYRLNVVHLIVPPLRDRCEDTRALFAHYLRAASEQQRSAPCDLEAAAWADIEAYRWPGNVRELRNVAERLAVRFAGRTVTVADVRRHLGPAPAAAGDPPPAHTEHVDPHVDANAPGGRSWRRPDLEVPPEFWYEHMTRGHESFWSVVYEPFMLRDITRETVRAIVRLALAEARGNYRIVLMLFNLPPTDYKRFLNFLHKYECHVPFQGFRVASGGGAAATDAAAPAARPSYRAKAAV